MTVVDLTVTNEAAKRPMSHHIERLLNLGYTGRDEAAVRAHIDELADEGISGPNEVPTLYPKPNHLVSTGGTFEVMSNRTSGEAEFVLLSEADRTYVGVGSDHTDREIESESISLAKAVCPNVMGDSVWQLSTVEDHWDELELRSWVTNDGDRVRYQEATVAEIRSPEDLLDIAADRMTAPLEGTAVFGGSVATETDGFVCGERFEVELHDPILDRTLYSEYDVEPISWIG